MPREKYACSVCDKEKTLSRDEAEKKGWRFIFWNNRESQGWDCVCRECAKEK